MFVENRIEEKMKKHKKASRYPADSAQGVGSGGCAVIRCITFCYHASGEPNGKCLEPGMFFEVLRYMRIDGRKFALVKVNNETEVVSVGDLFTG